MRQTLCAVALCVAFALAPRQALAAPPIAEQPAGTPAAATTTCGSHQFVSAVNGASAATCAQPAGSDVSGLRSWSIDLITTSQTGIASGIWTRVAFNHVKFDAASLCDVTSTKGRCTPNVAGTYRISAGLLAGGASLSPNNFINCAIYKNGAIYRNWYFPTNSSTTAAVTACSGLVDVNGSSDYIEIFVNVSTTASTATMTAGAADTWFDGNWVGP